MAMLKSRTVEDGMEQQYRLANEGGFRSAATQKMLAEMNSE